MGNIFDVTEYSSMSKSEETKLLSKEESDCFHSHFLKHEVKQSLSELLRSFECSFFPGLPKQIELCIYKGHSFPKELKAIEVETYFANALRTNTNNLMKFLFDPVDTSMECTFLGKAIFFLGILIEFSSTDRVNPSDIQNSASRIGSIFEKHLITYGFDEGFDTYHSWLSTHFPHIFDIIYDKIYAVCFSSLSGISSRRFRAPLFLDESAIVNPVDILPLAFENSLLQGEWKRLYTTQKDGQSFNRILAHISGYDGPTCIIISSTSDDQEAVFGAFAGNALRDSNRFHGSRDNFLFSIHPILSLLKTSGREANYQWVNSSSYGLQHGLGFGGTRERCRFFIAENLEDSYDDSTDSTYVPGRILPKEFNGKFVPGIIEIWGTGGQSIIDNALHLQEKRREVIADSISKARKVDKAQFANSSFDQEFLLTKTFAHKVRVADDV